MFGVIFEKSNSKIDIVFISQNYRSSWGHDLQVVTYYFSHLVNWLKSGTKHKSPTVNSQNQKKRVYFWNISPLTRINYCMRRWNAAWETILFPSLRMSHKLKKNSFSSFNQVTEKYDFKFGSKSVWQEVNKYLSEFVLFSVRFYSSKLSLRL